MLIAGGRSSVAWATTKALVRRRDIVLGTHRTEADEMLCECTAIACLLQRRGELLLVARACELRAEAAEKDVIRNGRLRRRRLVHPGVI